MNISKQQLLAVANEHNLPVFMYSLPYLRERALQLTHLTLPYGLVVRYAMKANPHTQITNLFHDLGLHFDASSSYEAAELLQRGVEGARISLSSQQPAHNLTELISAGVQYVATSMHQLELFADAAPKGAHVALRVNPGFGAGHSNRVTTGGANSSFGLWNTYLGDALTLAKRRDIIVDRVQVHIGAGADPKVWDSVMKTALELVDQMPDVTVLDIGGGYKIRRYGDEHETDMESVAEVFTNQLQAFASRTGREIKLEIEPGTWLVAHGGILFAQVVDIVDTGPDGHTFLKLNTGMNDIIRPSMYGAQHEIAVLNDDHEKQEYVVVGHNCETGDILTPAPNDPEGLGSRLLNRAHIDDVVAIYDVGAYCYTFAATGYNAFPSAEAVFIDA
jgi:diaminopimelate decarboxylase